MAMKITQQLIDIAKECGQELQLSANSSQHEKRSFEEYLRNKIQERLGNNYSEKVLSRRCRYRVDYFIEEEATVIELELSSHRSNTNFERDCFKVIIARDEDVDIKHFIMLGVYGTANRHDEPGPTTIKEVMKSKFGVEVQVMDITAAQVKP
jgi:hypothetical protein